MTRETKNGEEEEQDSWLLETIDRTTSTSRKSARKHDTQAQKTEWGRKVIEVLGEEVVGGLEEHEVCDCLETRVKPKER